MQFHIDPSVYEAYPTVCIGVLVATDVENRGSSAEVSALVRDEERRIRSQLSKDTFTELPKIAAWRKVYADFGVKPRDAKSSIENLYRIILSGKDLRSVSPLVDLYNFISIKHMLPGGGEDLDTFAGDLSLTKAGSSEPPVKLLGDEAAAPPLPGEVIYRDSVSAICRRWNWREADRTKLTAETKSSFLVVEGAGCVSEAEVAAALEELAGLTKRFCGAKVAAAILNRDRNSISLTDMLSAAK